MQSAVETHAYSICLLRQNGQFVSSGIAKFPTPTDGVHGPERDGRVPEPPPERQLPERRLRAGPLGVDLGGGGADVPDQGAVPVHLQGSIFEVAIPPKSCGQGLPRWNRAKQQIIVHVKKKPKAQNFHNIFFFLYI